MAKQKQGDQPEPTYSSSVRKRWTIGWGGEKGSGISMPMARHDDDDEIIYVGPLARKTEILTNDSKNVTWCVLVLNNQPYKIWIKCKKCSNPGKGPSTPTLHLGVVATEKGALNSSRQLHFFTLLVSFQVEGYA